MMVEVKRGRGRPRKNVEVKRPVGRPPKKKMGRPVGSKNKSKQLSKPRTVKQRLDRLELAMLVAFEAINILNSTDSKKKAR